MQGNFFADLFDFKFKEFITPRIVGILYIIFLVLIAIMVLFMVVSGFTQGFGSGLIALIVAPIAGLLWVIMTRVYMEFMLVMFRIYDRVGSIADAKGIASPSPAPGTPEMPPPPAS